MNSNQLIAAIVALIVVGFIVWVLRGRISGLLFKSGNSRFEVKAAEAKAPEPGIKASDFTSESGAINVATHTGDRIDAQKFRAHEDIQVTQNNPDPKA